MSRERIVDIIPEASLLPTAATDQHAHPIPRSFRVLLAVYALVLGLALAGLFGLYLNERRNAIARAQAVAADTAMAEQQTQAEVARVAAQVKAELDRRSAEDEAEAARVKAEIATQQARTREAVCIVLSSGDVGMSPRIAALAEQLECP